MPGMLFAAQVPLLTAIVAWLLFCAAWRSERELAPFLLALGAVPLCLAGLGISIWPDVVPAASRSGRRPRPSAARSSCWSASALIVPLILAYTALGLLGVPRQGRHEGYH